MYIPGRNFYSSPTSFVVSSSSRCYRLKPDTSPDKPGATLIVSLSPASLLLPLCCIPLTDCTLVWVAWYYYFPDKFPKVLLMLHLTFSLNWLILLCFIRFAPSGLRTRPEHKCLTIQRTLPHLKGWNLLNLIAWTEPAIFGLQWTSILMGRLLVSVPSLFHKKNPGNKSHFVLEHWPITEIGEL